MRFEQFDQDYEAAEQLLPDGDHECEIVKVKEWFAKDQSRTALIVTLQPVEGDCSPIEKWLDPSQKRDHRAAMQLLDAVGIPRDQDLGDDAVGCVVGASSAVVAAGHGCRRDGLILSGRRTLRSGLEVDDD